MAIRAPDGANNALYDIHFVFNTIISYIPTFQILLIGEKKIRTFTGKGDLNDCNQKKKVFYPKQNIRERLRFSS